VYTGDDDLPSAGAPQITAVAARANRRNNAGQIFVSRDVKEIRIEYSISTPHLLMKQMHAGSESSSAQTAKARRRVLGGAKRPAKNNFGLCSRHAAGTHRAALKPHESSSLIRAAGLPRGRSRHDRDARWGSIHW
jgi:hypothetical protein